MDDKTTGNLETRLASLRADLRTEYFLSFSGVEPDELDTTLRPGYVFEDAGIRLRKPLTVEFRIDGRYRDCWIVTDRKYGTGGQGETRAEALEMLGVDISETWEYYERNEAITEASFFAAAFEWIEPEGEGE